MRLIGLSGHWRPAQNWSALLRIPAVDIWLTPSDRFAFRRIQRPMRFILRLSAGVFAGRNRRTLARAGYPWRQAKLSRSDISECHYAWHLSLQPNENSVEDHRSRNPKNGEFFRKCKTSQRRRNLEFLESPHIKNIKRTIDIRR